MRHLFAMLFLLRLVLPVPPVLRVRAAGDTAGAGAGAVSVSGNKDSCSPALGALGACGSIKPGNPAGAFVLAGLSALRLDGLKESGPGRNGGKKLSVWPNFCACNSPTPVRG
jgi:hypothetical protein